MTEPTTIVTESDPDVIEPDGAGPAELEATLVEEELLVEDVSIDGMCGVY